MQHLRKILAEIDSLIDATMDRLPHQACDLDMYRGKLAGLQLAHATILRKLAELEERRERDTDTDPRCEGCKQPNRTVGVQGG